MSDDELSAIESQIVKVILENRQLRAQNAELHRRLVAQIAQNGQLIRQGRKLDGETPQYVTAENGPDVCNKCGVELSFGEGVYCERCYAEGLALYS
ncbi:MAG: hypothetical protein WC565_06400 [Parcubacteria group bacterium]